MDIAFSGILILLNIYLYIYVGLESPAATETELGAAFWPRIILVLMTILLAVNLVKQIRERKNRSEEETAREEKPDVAGFLRSKLFFGMIIVVVFSVLLPLLGFIPSCILFLVVYGILLGADHYVKLILFSVIITFVLYLVFQSGLQIMLPRGVGVLREFALFVESITRF